MGREKELDLAREERRHWHLGREIPVAVIMTMLIQTLGIVWWASGLSSRVDQLERNTSASAWQAEKIIRIDEKLSLMQSTITDLKSYVQMQPAVITPAVPRNR